MNVENKKYPHYKIKYFRIDGGGEYKKEFKELVNSLGITRQITCTDTPQSNGKAEWLNRTLAESVRAMLFQANMPKSFWAEAMSVAAYIRNYMPSSVIDGKIPYELWEERKVT